MEAKVKAFGVLATLYACRTLCNRGWVAIWKGQHSAWRSGFVIRILWFGFVLRWGYIPYRFRRAEAERTFRQLLNYARIDDASFHGQW